MSNHVTARVRCLAVLLCLALLLTACSGAGGGTDPDTGPAASDLQSNNGPSVGPAPVPDDLLLPLADGVVVYENNGVRLDASHTELGYIMVRSDETGARMKVRVACGEATYTYDLPGGIDYTVLPLQMGDGDYTVRVLRHAYDNLYEPLFDAAFSVALTSEFAPFLVPNQYVSYTADTGAVAESFALAGTGEEADRIAALYRYVADTIAYDYDKAEAVETGALTVYLPDADRTLDEHKGICFDYASLLAVMLRAQGIPAQLVIGQVEPEGILHAWNLVYTDGAWQRMDATFDDTVHTDDDYTPERYY